MKRLSIKMPLAFSLAMLMLIGCKSKRDISKTPFFPYKLRYDMPAGSDFYQGLPIGNGKMGGMIYGNPQAEIININEGTIWTGSPYENNVKGAYSSLKDLQFKQLTRNLNNDEEWEKALIYGKQNEDVYHGQAFQYAGQILLEFHGHEDYDKDSYRRELDINNSLVTNTYTLGPIDYKREYFASYPSNVIGARFESSKKASLSFKISFASDNNGRITIEGNSLIYDGITDSRKGIEGKLEYRLIIEVIKKGGKLKRDKNSIEIVGANSCDLIITVGTNFKDYQSLDNDYKSEAKNTIKKAKKKGYDKLKELHIADYRKIFDKLAINLGDSSSEKSTNVRLLDFKDNEDPSLIALFFQYNRYLLISSSRQGGQVANLQGIWNNLRYPPWDSKYTSNINLQMNYWPAYIGNLSECAVPFTDKVISLTKAGASTAKELYNIDKGWTLHHNTDLWNITGPVDGPWGLTPMCGPWLCNQLYDNYLYNADIDYLKSIYDTLKGSAEFVLDFLVEYEDSDGKTYLVTCPSTSPELMQKGPNPKYISFSSAFDLQIIHQLFTNVIEATRTLDRDYDLAKRIEDALKRLPGPIKIGKWGQVQEFYFHDYDDINERHRHISNLIGAYPMTSIDLNNQANREALKTTLEARTKAGDWTGWGIGWRIGQYARLEDETKAYEMIKLIFDLENRLTYPNLFGAHPMGDNDKAFQIDGNFGALAGICEMLVSSAYGDIKILPALPKEWASGEVYGICARGGFVIDELIWEKGSLKSIKVRSTKDGLLKLTYKDKTLATEAKKDKTYTFTFESFN